MPSQVQSNSTTPAALATDHQLGTDITTAGIYVLEIDTDNLVAGETLLLIFKSKVRSSSGFKELERLPVASGDQAIPLVKFGPFEIIHGGQFFIRQEGGTLRAFEWSMRNLTA
jgi:hypothetical protein